jgi:glycosyltransferase involved in cell wall biosynthesis
VKGERYVFALLQRLAAARPEIGFFVSGTLSLLLREELDVSGLAARVFSPGPLPWAENLAFAASCRLCLSPALAENFSMALLEALHVGAPIATFDVGGNRELVGDCGAVVRYLDLDALATAALRLLEAPASAAAVAKQRAAAIQATARERWVALLRSLVP